MCAGAIVKQSNYMQANGPAVITMVATIYDAEGIAYPPVAESYQLAVPDELEIKNRFEWEAPALPPNNYVRVLGANSESIRPPAMSITHFSVVACDDAGNPIVPIPTPINPAQVTP